MCLEQASYLSIIELLISLSHTTSFFKQTKTNLLFLKPKNDTIEQIEYYLKLHMMYVSTKALFNKSLLG